MTQQEERRAAHKAKMQRKATERQRWYERNGNQPFPATVRRTRNDPDPMFVGYRIGVNIPNFPASINRHTGEPHLHAREIARRAALASFKPQEG